MRHNSVFLPVISAIIFVLVSVGPGTCKEIVAYVDFIIDGDTMVVSAGSKKYTIRLWGIDAPERKEKYFNASRSVLSVLAANKKVTVDLLYVDTYNRHVAKIYSDGVMLNQRMVESGYARVYAYFCDEDICSQWKVAEDMARQEGRGMWGR